MTYTLIVRPEAELDTATSAKWYEEKQENLGIRFLDEVEEKLHSFTQNPLQYQIRYKSTRLAIVDHFPYAIHYIVEDRKVIVLAVLGTRDDPDKWYK
jgi:plasmid stabilization system protein ParE